MKSKIKIGILILVLLFILIHIYAQKRGFRFAVKKLDPSFTVGKQYLLLIAIDRYKEWLPLKNPVKDAREIKEILLTRYYIDRVIELYDTNATKANILRTCFFPLVIIRCWEF